MTMMVEFVDDSKCPYCGSDDIICNGDKFLYNNNAVEDAQVCNTCGKKFWFIYKCVRSEDKFGKEI